MKGKKILVGISGGIAAYKICNLVRLFVKAGAEVKVVMTPSATQFVSPLALSVLSKNEVMINMFPKADDWSKEEKAGHSTWHINLGLWADAFVIAPATANTIGKIEAGICDNFLLTVVFAARCPMILSPSMDVDMYKHSITQRNISSLKSKGFKIIEPVKGELASGLHGEGKMPEPEAIFDFVEKVLVKKKDLKGKKVLVTAGPTKEPIDPVRYISNHSSGKMGFEIAKAAFERGADVTLISGPVKQETPYGIKIIDVNTAAEMFEAVKGNYKEKDIIVMSAAVGDYKTEQTSTEKIKKTSGILSLNLVKNPDILKYLGEKKKKYILAGFALETENGIENAKKKLKEKNLDFIVLNNPKVEGAGFEHNTNVVSILSKNKIKHFDKMTKAEVAGIILDNIIRK